ncbi:MAG: hypothetical protein DRQ51_01700 [Gammaproteobacteria bacterium]|nr:MAG: hypothetical protein DRQ51_01700 [Gammaproteobacteria bacterium]
MITITIPNNNNKEREYVISVIFKEFMCIDYNIQYGSKNYEIKMKNNSKLIVIDCFFNKHPTSLSYLKNENIPKKINLVKNQFTNVDGLPVIYGNNKLEIKEDIIVCGTDIFASIFFMLSRWEEYVNKNRDYHNRFPATESIAFKYNFLNRPIVDECIKMLKNMLIELDSSLTFNQNKTKLYLTHDVDEVYRWKNWRQVIRSSLGDIIKRQNLKLGLKNFSKYFLIKRNKTKEPFDTFDWLMNESEKLKTKSRFYFMSGGNSIYDRGYAINDKYILNLIKKIKKNNHYIGFHPSYNTYNDLERFKQEKELLSNVVGIDLKEGRQHFLRFEVPTTWQIWEDSGMKVDSTCGYADKEGFRCGTAYEYSVFNILTRIKLNLKERPLIVMDCTLFRYMNHSHKSAMNSVLTMQNKSKNFTILWHNSHIDDMIFYKNFLKKQC